MFWPGCFQSCATHDIFLSLCSNYEVNSFVFGCAAFVNIHSQHCPKFDPHVVKGDFLGYTTDKMGFKYYYPLNCLFFVSMDIAFHEIELHHLYSV